MAITKTGSLLSQAVGLGAPIGIGVGRASQLTKEDEALLKEHYDLGKGSNLQMRNAGRGLAGSFLGGLGPAVLLGGLATGTRRGRELTELAMLNPAIGRKLRRYVTGIRLASGIGGAYGMTGKYSKGNADSIRKEMEAKKD